MTRYALLLVIVVAAAISVLALRSSFSATSCTGAQAGPGIPGSPPPAAANVSPDIIQAWIANKARLTNQANPTGGPTPTPAFEGTPPNGFTSWGEFSQWVQAQLSSLTQKPEPTAAFQAGGSVGGVAGQPNVCP